jgi:hypothetical protein
MAVEIIHVEAFHDNPWAALRVACDVTLDPGLTWPCGELCFRPSPAVI